MMPEINPDISDIEFNHFTSFIKKHYGISIGSEKQALLVGRLKNVLVQMNFENFSQYFDYIISDNSGDAVITLLNKVTTNHTYFMRENSHFKYFKDHIVPYLRKSNRERDLRIWSAGCSSGEEPYTLAMILEDEFGGENAVWNKKILATDISTSVLEKAKKGRYLNDQIEPLPGIWKMNYFKNVNHQTFELNENIKKEVVFRRFNLMENEFPFKKKFHVIFCRNVMIYFDEKTKYELINKFYNNLETGGYLFIGQSETLKRDLIKFRHVMPAIYRKE